MKKTVLAGILCFLLTNVFSQTEDRKWNIGGFGGLAEYNGDLGHAYYPVKEPSYGVAGISFSRMLTQHFDASVFFTRGEIGYVDHTKAGDFDHSFLIRHNTGNLVLRFNFTKPKSFVRPYLFAGIGAIWIEAVYNIHHERFETSAPTFGAGFNFRFGPIVSLQLQETFLMTSTDNLDHVNAGQFNDMFLYHTAGLTFNLGRKQDADHDGVSDKNDMCPETPPGVTVDSKGCPLDRDGDGVADYLDACPDTPGPAALKGCPDRDNDGVADKEDRCPDVAGPVELKGCPDSDKDGVADIDDKCPGTKTGYHVDPTGCPLDNDKDGIVNEEDRCPDQAGIQALAGCPDSDGDGVSDADDRCPQTKGTIANKGCPEMAQEDVLRITVIASKIYFETNSDKLKLISNSQLDDLAQILKKYEGVKLTIEGHTDSDGDDAYNMTLSQKRTESVKEYLISKGISADRLTAIGYGETRPVADNKTAAGKAKNRRVELKTSY